MELGARERENVKRFLEAFNENIKNWVSNTHLTMRIPRVCHLAVGEVEAMHILLAA